jgi:hypothetical protein
MWPLYLTQHTLLPIKLLWIQINLQSLVATISTTYFNNQQLFILYLFHAIISLNNVNQLIFVTVKCCSFLPVRTELFNIILVTFALKTLMTS